MHASRRNTVVSFAAVATAIGSSLLATACGGGGKGDFSNASLVTLNTASVPAGATGQAYASQVTANFPHPPGQFVVTAGRLPPGVERAMMEQTFKGQFSEQSFKEMLQKGTNGTYPDHSVAVGN